MPNYNADKMQAGVVARAGLGVQSVSAEITIGTALILNDTISFLRLPPNSVVRDVIISSNATQSGNDSVFTLGDAVDPDRYITTAAGLCLRTGGGVARLNAHTGLHFVNTAETILLLTVTTAGTGQTTGGVVRASVIYDMQR